MVQGKEGIKESLKLKFHTLSSANTAEYFTSKLN